MKQKIYEMLRMYVAKRVTHNLGKVEITDDEVICYVDEKKLKKQMKETVLNRYNIMLHSIPFKEEIYKIYKLDKPVHYIIKNVNFGKEINVMASTKNCHVTFENCNFKSWIAISFADYITFKNNTYNVSDYRHIYSIVPHGEFHISTRRITEVNKLEFINDKIKVDSAEIIQAKNINDISKKKSNTKKGIIEMWLYAKEISFINSEMINIESLELDTEKIIIENSNLDVESLSIFAGDIIANNSTINTYIAAIDSYKNNIISQVENININYNNLFVDGIEMNKNEDINKENLELQQKRIELINSLRKIERTCEKQIFEEIKKQPLTRILKNNKKKK